MSGDQNITVTIPVLNAGLLARREVRDAMRAVRVLGGEVLFSEHKRLLGSVMTIRAAGTEQELTPLLKVLERHGILGRLKLKGAGCR